MLLASTRFLILVLLAQVAFLTTDVLGADQTATSSDIDKDFAWHVLRGGHRQHGAAVSFPPWWRTTSNTLIIDAKKTVEDALVKLGNFMERKEGFTNFQQRLLVEQQQKNKKTTTAAFEISEGEMADIKQEVENISKALEQEDALGVTRSIKSTVGKLHAMLNKQSQEEEWSNGIDYGDSNRRQLVSALDDEKTMTVDRMAMILKYSIQYLAMAMEAENMDALTLHVDTITKALQSSVATLHYTLEEQEQNDAEIGKRLLDDNDHQLETVQEVFQALATRIADMGRSIGENICPIDGSIECIALVILLGLLVYPLLILLLPGLGAGFIIIYITSILKCPWCEDQRDQGNTDLPKFCYCVCGCTDEECDVCSP